jgi:hypothetical protein
MKNLLALFLLLTIGNLYSQCEFHTDNGIYKATCFKSLVSDNGDYMLAPESLVSDNGDYMLAPEISIAKNGNSGFFILKLGSLYSHGGLRGNVIVYLDDNSKITLINRNLQWKVNRELFCQYVLTTKEILKLKKTNIKAVRFWRSYDDGALEYYNKDHSSMVPINFGDPNAKR